MKDNYRIKVYHKKKLVGEGVFHKSISPLFLYPWDKLIITDE